MKRDVERLVELRVLDDAPAEEPRDEDEVARARHGSELGQPLRDAEDDGLKDAHGVGTCYPASIAPLGISAGSAAIDTSRSANAFA
jgi:hypothetical protein